MFLITGITGQVGGAAAAALLADGHPVRALVRDKGRAAPFAARGVELVTGDVEQAADVARALDGVSAAYLMIPPLMAPSPDFREAKAVIASYAAALAAAPPPRLVVLSSFGSEQPHGLGNITSTHLFEAALRDVDVPTALVRPGGFIENYLHVLPRVRETGILDSFYDPTERPVPMTATRDIGRTVADLMLEPFASGKVVEVGDRISPDAIAAAMADVLGRPVAARAVPRAAWPAAMTAMGLPEGRTTLYEEMMDGINSGWIDWRGSDRRPGVSTPREVFAARLN